MRKQCGDLKYKWGQLGIGKHGHPESYFIQWPASLFQEAHTWNEGNSPLLLLSFLSSLLKSSVQPSSMQSSTTVVDPIKRYHSSLSCNFWEIQKKTFIGHCYLELPPPLCFLLLSLPLFRLLNCQLAVDSKASLRETLLLDNSVTRWYKGTSMSANLITLLWLAYAWRAPFTYSRTQPIVETWQKQGLWESPPMSLRSVMCAHVCL